MELCHTPLMYAVLQCSVGHVRSLLQGGQVDVEDWVDTTDPKTGITPLMATAIRPDEETAVEIAELLLQHGAKVDTRDCSGPGAFPVFMASQEGKSVLLSFLIENGADIMQSPIQSTTKAIWIAAQNGHAQCVARLAEAGSSLEATNRAGKTPASTAVEMAHPEALGVLAKAGADLRRAVPCYYADEQGHTFDPSYSWRVHHALDMTVQSFNHLICLACGEGDGSTLSRCGKCRMAHFCNKECQMKCWPSHKACCAKIKKGASHYGNPTDPIPDPNPEPYGFADDFTEADDVIRIPEDYIRDEHPVWEYNAGSRGRLDWRRYPPRIEESLESMSVEMQAPTFMFRPGRPDCNGKYERTRTNATPSRNVATRHVTFEDMTEREVYSGASRIVRRNGKRMRKPLPEPF